MQPQSTHPETGKAVHPGCARLLEAAGRLFAEHGYAGTSIADLARVAGMSKSTVFHHFGSKEELYFRVIRDAVARFGRTLNEILESEGAFAERLKHMQRSHLQHVFANRNVALLILRELQSADSERGGRLAADVFSTNFTLVVRLLEEGQRQGLVRREVNCPVAALMLVSMNVQYFQARDVLIRLPGLEAAADPDWWVEQSLDVFLKGLECAPELRG